VIDSRSAVHDVLSHIRISNVFAALTGITPRRTGRDTWRSKQPGGDSPNRVSGDDSRNVYFDFVTGDGGGVLDLVMRVRGGTRRDALRWAADFAGVPLDDRPLSAGDRARCAAEQGQMERDLRQARHWRRTAVRLTEDLLCELKSAFFDPMAEEKPSSLELQALTRLLARLERLEGRALVDEYRWWAERCPHTTALMARWGRDRERAERRALLAYLRQTNPERPAA